MTDNRELNIVQIEATGFQDLCNRIAELEKENEFLDKQLRTEFQIICKKQDTNASAVLREFIEQYVNENK